MQGTSCLEEFQEQIKELEIKLILYVISKIILAIFIRIYYRGFLQKAVIA